jgi:hypothetical protein
VQIRRIVAGLTLDDTGGPSEAGVQQELPASQGTFIEAFEADSAANHRRHTGPA